MFLLYHAYVYLEFLILACTIYILAPKHCYGYLKLTAILTVALPAVIGAAVALNWDRTFVTFHEIAFNNDYWLFDPATDPVINILPDLYFLHFAVIILALVILGSILCAWAYRAEKRKNNK